MQLTPLEELKRRVQVLQFRLRQEDLDGALLTEKMIFIILPALCSRAFYLYQWIKSRYSWLSGI